MNFWRFNEAAPSLLDTWLRCEPRYLRTNPPPKPNLGNFTCERGTTKHATEICDFWSEHYKGDGWSMRMPPELLTKYLDDFAVYCILLRLGNQLIGTIFSTPSGAVMSHGVEMPELRVIEGLCVHSDYRRKGVAGLLIGYIDWLLSARGPSPHMWSREESMIAGIISTCVSRKIYSYRNCWKRTGSRAKKLSYDEFMERYKVIRFKAPYIHSIKPNSWRGDLDYWELKDNLVVIANTRRITNRGAPIYEIVMSEPRNIPSYFLDEICENYDSGQIFTTQLFETLSLEWTLGASGTHAWYLYNFIPPAFGYTNVTMVREEL
jgi:GNAT superfamily N-acetyltransferase